MSARLIQRLRDAAIGEAPATTPRYACHWVGYSHQWKVLDWLPNIFDGHFYQSDEDTQRTFLLLIAEAMERA